MADKAQSPFHRLDHVGLRESVAKSIREAIQSGALKPGERLVEADIAEQMGISRAPVREALRQLEGEGLVETAPRRATAVARFSRDDILEIYSLRAVLEGLASRLTTERASGEDCRRLRDAVQRMREAAARGDLPALVENDLAFHRMVCEMSQHRRLLASWLGLCHQARVCLMWIEQIYGDLMETAEGHLPLLDAIERGDGVGAEALFREHLVRSGKALADKL